MGGKLGAPLFVAYLWVTFGNGFRYGRAYLFCSMFLNLFGFSVVVALSPYWQNNTFFSIAIILGLILLPMYVAKLIRQINEAVIKAENANQAKTSFLANMSHEIRTPLNGVIGMTDLLVGTRMNREQKDFVQTIQASANALLALVEDILDISKIEVGKLRIERNECDLPMLVNSTAKMMEPQAKDKGLYLKVDISQNVPIVVLTDAQHLRQVLINLIGNAIKFTEEGGIELRVTKLEEKEHNNLAVRFEVIDTGIGIPKEVQDKIFDTFTQADDSVTRRYGGTGLGTAISKQLIETMGGKIGLQSSPDQGSRFWFVLDFSLPTSETVKSPTRGLSTKKLLIVQSEASEAGLYEIVSPWMRETHTVHTEQQALRELRDSVQDNDPFDLVLVNSPHFSEVRFAERIKSDEDVKGIELVLATSASNAIQTELFKEAGYRDLVSIPIDVALLFNTLHNAVMEEFSETSDVSRLSDYFPVPPTVKGLNILVAEDNPINQKVVSKILERAGHHVELVENGQMALEKLEQHRYDLTILDMQMPVMGGIDAIKMFRFSHVDSQMPFIMLTANATVEAVKEAEDIGVDAFVTKPFQARKLIETIDSVARQNQIEPNVVVLPTAKREEKASTDLTKLAELASLSHDPKFLEEIVYSFVT
ncbi:MAG: ATP-binding protein, partial [Arenicellales bacterium]|nr:ATP-binding protein [Arenicellales bacterium]